MGAQGIRGHRAAGSLLKSRDGAGGRAIGKDSGLSVAEALAVLLQTWNSQFYRFRGGFTAKHYAEIDRLLDDHWKAILDLRPRSIEIASGVDLDAAASLFHEFEEKLGPTGASKALHLLAPRLFPLWETKIAKRYGFYIGGETDRARMYRRFMDVARQHIKGFGGESASGRNPLKAWDEWNYCKYGPG